MTTTQIIAQIISIIAMAFNILSYQGKNQRAVIACQLVGGLFFSINFFLLNATVGAILNIIAVIRAIVFLYKDKLHAEHPAWLVGFCLSYIAVYVFTFTVLNKEPNPFNLTIELLPVIGMIALNIGFMQKTAADIRKFGLISSPAWLIYNIIVGSWGAIICETLSLISIFAAMLRIDKTKNS